MQIIALTGQARAGKTHIVNELARQAFEAGQRPVFVSFAGALKRASAEAGFPKDSHPAEYRKFCQEHGAEMRQEDPDYWVKRTMEEIKSIAAMEQASIEAGDKYWERVVLIDDVRYENEIDAVARMEGVFLHVWAGDRLPTPHARWRRHESEKLAKRIDRTASDPDKLEKIFHDRMVDNIMVECQIFWVDNDGSAKALTKLLDKFGKFFIGTHVAETAKPAEKKDPRKRQDISSAEMDGFLNDLNKMFDDLDIDREDRDDDWEEYDDDIDA